MWQKNTFKCWPSSCVCVVSCGFVIALYIYRMIVIERRLWSHTHKHTKSTIVLTTHCQSTKGDIGQSNETSHLNRVVPHQSICTKSNGKCCKVYDRIASNIHSLTHWHKDLIDCHQYCVCVCWIYWNVQWSIGRNWTKSSDNVLWINFQPSIAIYGEDDVTTHTLYRSIDWCQRIQWKLTMIRYKFVPVLRERYLLNVKRLKLIVTK